MNKMSTKIEMNPINKSFFSEKGIIDHSQLSLVHKLIPPKWFTKVKIVVSPDYHFIVIAMIDSGADMNCI